MWYTVYGRDGMKESPSFAMLQTSNQEKGGSVRGSDSSHTLASRAKKNISLPSSFEHKVSSPIFRCPPLHLRKKKGKGREGPKGERDLFSASSLFEGRPLALFPPLLGGGVSFPHCFPSTFRSLLYPSSLNSTQKKLPGVEGTAEYAEATTWPLASREKRWNDEHPT